MLNPESSSLIHIASPIIVGITPVLACKAKLRREEVEYLQCFFFRKAYLDSEVEAVVMDDFSSFNNLEERNVVKEEILEEHDEINEEFLNNLAVFGVVEDLTEPFLLMF